ncbi:MAG TPA: 2-dehydropantoate 2-reductase [Gemmatimonadales bacterium]|nr:2-dehydropantoate 2-reductase [Gemmatimonadales bacterium]
MRIAVFGAGGAGGYFGARLARAGEEVVWIARGQHLDALRTRGLRVESIDGDFTLGPVEASDDPGQFRPVDAVLLGVKAWQVTDAARAMRPLIAEETCVVPLQNGVEASDELRAVLGDRPVLGGVAKVFSFLVGPGHLRRPGGPATVVLGELDNRLSDRVRRLAECLRGAGLGAEIPADIKVALWEKFLFVASGGGLGAVTRAPIGIVRSVPETRALLEAAMEEIRAVARARGVGLPDDVVPRTMAFVDTLPAAGTASLQRDLAAGRPSELEWWSGAVARLGAEAGVATPIHAFVYWSMLPTELRARGRLTFPPEA